MIIGRICEIIVCIYIEKLKIIVMYLKKLVVYLSLIY